MAKQVDKNAIQDWELFLKNIRTETTVDSNIPYAEREKKRKELEADCVAWCIEMFPNYAKSPFAKFQIKFIYRVITHPEWYEVISWSRELAKSTIVMMVILYLVLTGKKKNVLLVSSTQDNAIRLLKPYRANLQANQRILHYYGKQQGITWKEDELLTKKGVAFRALGAGQAPRGTRNEDVRPDVLLMDDFDTDEECRNPEIVEKKWKWFEEALYFTRSMSEPLLTIWCGNIIAPDCCVVRAGNRARELAKKGLGNWDIINIRMVDINHPDPEQDYLYGTSVWEKNSEEQIDIVLSQVSYVAGQKECFNNPVEEGTIFKDIRWGKIPQLRQFQFLVAYGDPSPSNKENKKNSFKAIPLIGRINNTYYILTCFLDHPSNENFIRYYFSIDEWVNQKTVVYNFIENNSLQDPFWEQVLCPLILKVRAEKNKELFVRPDTRDKPDKASRIESLLEPIHREGRLILNEAEKGNPHMQELERQFKRFNMKLSYPADGPDAVEGGVWIINNKVVDLQPPINIPRSNFTNKKRF
ncbi:hypothetical protein LJC16_02165 [Bacteroidales bacterium OttesenSCG-928-C19]|nr:hypothetical protein [Bacteroidales bacterium OttesenSCG-928-C19]